MINIFGSGNELYQEFARKTFKIYLSLMVITCLVKMNAIFFQSIGKSIRAVVASLIRDIVCFTPIVLILFFVFENNNPSSGISGILYAAPIADFIAVFVIFILIFSFFKNLQKTHVNEEEVKSDIAESKQGIIITISREHGSKGKHIAKQVAKRLNIPFYYKEMISIAAKESGLDQEFITDLNNNAPNILYDLCLSTDVVKQAIIAQEKIIRKIVDSGTCVIVGRASDYILRDYDNVVNVFIHAPKEFRVKNIMEMYNDDEKAALENLKKPDHARSSYYRNITGQKWGNPSNYTLSINSSFGIDLCVK